MIHAATKPDLDLKNEVSDFKRRRIREEACGLFYEMGYERTTLDAIAKRLKVTKPFLYKHYDNKGELLYRNLSDRYRALSGCCQCGLCRNLDPATERLQGLAESVLEVIFEYQKFIVVYTREEKNLRPEEATRNQRAEKAVRPSVG
jgi:AcrR family transcriptional regulator